MASTLTGPNPLRFFLWVYYKEIVYLEDNRNEEDLQRKLQTATLHIKKNLRALQNISRCFLKKTEHFINALFGSKKVVKK